MVFRNNDVLDASWGESFQDKQGRIVDKNSKGSDIYSLLCLCK